MRKRASRLRRVALLTSAPAAERRAEGSGVSIFDEPMIDCHTHVLDPVRFAYASDVAYRPSGQEIGTRPSNMAT